ncbi:MAG TPA: PilZ domain-containing protein [Bryobacteraceae bacterium]|nr:PilZ domain-containing protein [Bryobacteraceae bacterium]
MDYLLEMVQKPFAELRGEQQIAAVLIVLLCVFIAFSAVFQAVRGMKGRRRYWRHRQTGPIDVSWRSSLGSPRREQGRCVDMSAGGLRMELQDPILVGTPVSFHLLQTKRAGTAFVRHCTPDGSKFYIGVEFAGSR